MKISSLIFIITIFSGCSINNIQSNRDSDFDGVIDIYDKCPNTPFMDIVDENGCSLKTSLEMPFSENF